MWQPSHAYFETISTTSNLSRPNNEAGNYIFQFLPQSCLFEVHIKPNIPLHRIDANELPVVARIRPLLDKELDKDIIVHAEGQDGKPMSIVRISNPKNEAEVFSFAFNGVYDIETTQEELFTKEGMADPPSQMTKAN